jgi:glycosyltransferase involved in cell wall biosynthesis
VAAALNEQLARSGDRVEVLTSRMRGFASHEQIGAVMVHRSACVRRDAHYTTALELSTTLLPAWREGCRLIEAFQPNLVHTHFVLPSGVIAWRLARRYKVPYVVTAHGSDIPGYNPDRFATLHRLLKPFWRQIVANASLLVSPSEFLAGLIRAQVDLPIRVIPNGYAPAASLGKTKRNLVLVVARLFPRKGVQRFIEAIPGMPRDWEYVIAGDGPQLPRLKELAERLRVPVRFVGFVDAHTLRGYYEEAKILVFPSIRENFPMVLLEAMDAGCAVITTDAEGCGEVVGKTGVVVRKDDAQQIRSALRELMGNAKLCEELRRKAMARADQFRWPRIAGLYRDAFGSAFASAPLTDTAIQRRLVV